MDLKRNIYNLLTYINVLIFKINYDVVIFSHVPQCGGNSILHIFKFFLGYRFLDVKRTEVDHLIKNPNILKKKISGKIIILGHFGIDFVNVLEKNFNKKRIFYLFNLRKPEHRYLSNYYRNKRVNKDKLSLNSFLIQRKKECLDNTFVRFLSGKNIYNINKKMINQKIFNIAIKNLKKFDTIIFIDEQKNQMKIIIKKLIYFPIFLNFFNFHKNKVSNSQYKSLSKKEIKNLKKLTKFDNQIYLKAINGNFR